MRKAAYCSQKVSENGTNYYLIDHIVSLNKNSLSSCCGKLTSSLRKAKAIAEKLSNIKLGHTHLMFLYQSISQLFPKFQITRQIQV